MHMACDHTGWYAAAADKLLFQTVMAGAGLPTPDLLVVTRRHATLGQVVSLADHAEAEAFLRDPACQSAVCCDADQRRNIRDAHVSPGSATCAGERGGSCAAYLRGKRWVDRTQARLWGYSG